MIGQRIKDPQDIRTYTFDWSAWLTSLSSDTVATSVWVVPSGLTNVAESNTTVLASVKLSGGTAGTTYTVSNRITTTTLTQTRQVSFELIVETQ